jgi:RNA polymerase sigma factor (TIGR02999 family)
VETPISQLIHQAETGSGPAAGQLFAALYRELHYIAEREVRRGGNQFSLGTTSLLHEAYLNIVAREGVRFASRPQFLAYAARAMRGLMIDYARQRRAKKRGSEFQITAVNSDVIPLEDDQSAEELARLAGALDTLKEVDPLLAQLVDLHFFCGFSFAEVAELRGVSERTIQRDWRKARLLLHHALNTE